MHLGAAHRLLDQALRDHGEFDVFGLLIRRHRVLRTATPK
jgi:hypothetical protein